MRIFKRIRLPQFNRQTFAFIGVTLVTFGLLTSLFQNEVAASWADTGWYFRKKLTIDSAQVSGTSNLTDFPVLVKFSDRQIKDHAQSDGDDLMFTSADGTTQLDHEIERYDSSTGFLVAWVRIPTLSYDTDTDIYLYYGNPNATNQENVTGTWNSSYEAVWHMSESSGTRADSTDGSLDLTENGTGGVVQVEGISGYAGDFELGDSDYLSIANASAGALNVGDGTDITLTSWVNIETTTGAGFNGIAGKWDNSSEESYLSHLGDISGNHRAFGRFSNDGSTATLKRNDTYGGNGFMNGGEWYMVTLTLDDTGTGGFMCVWINNSEDCRTYSGNTYNSAADFLIGAVDSATVSQFFDGIIDEVRFSSTLRTDDWITTEYNNISDPEGFFSAIAAPESIDDPIMHWMFNEGTDNTCSGGEDTCNSSGNYNHGTFSNTPVWQEESMCLTGSCLYFDGVDDRVDLGDNNLVDDSDLTLSAWIKVTDHSADEGTIIGKYIDDNDRYTFRVETDGKLKFFKNDANSCGGGDFTQNCEKETTNTITLNKWHHVVVVYDYSANDADIYMDGQLQALDIDEAFDSNLANGDDHFYIGRRGDNSDEFNGFIDEVKVYDYARTEGQIRADFLRGAGPRGSSAVFGLQDNAFLNKGLIGYWKMEDGVSGDAETIADSSGNNNDGTTSDVNATGMDCTVAGKFGLGCDFDGTDDYVDFGDLAVFDSSDLTISAWINIDDYSADEATIFSKYNNDDRRWTFRVETDGSLMFLKEAGVGDSCNAGISGHCDKRTAAGVISTDVWHHVAAVFTDDDNGLEFFVDGEQVPKSQFDETFVAGLSAGDDVVRIGRREDNSDELNGTVDEARVYHRALSSGEIKALYNWAPGPVGYWNFDENTGTTSAFDRSGNAYDLTLTSAVEASWTPGQFGSGLRFDGSSDYATATSENGNFSNNNYSVSSWIYRTTDSGGIEAIVDNRDADNDGWVLSIDASDTVTCSYNAIDATSVTTISVDTWYHVGCTADGTDVEVFVNGIKESSTTQSGSISETTDVRIATQSYGTSQKFAGIIDDVRVYNYARTPAQIIEDMNGGHPLGGSPIGSQAAYWKFDEQSGQTANDSVGSNDGTLGQGATADSRDPSWQLNDVCKINGCLEFDAADDFINAGSDSSIDNIFDSGGAIAAWIYPQTMGENNIGYIINKASSTTPDDGFAFFLYNTGGVSNALGFEQAFDTQAGSWITQDNSMATNEWQHVVVVYDNDSDANVPTIYINGIEQELTEVFAPSGTRETDAAQTAVIGNNSTSSQTRTFDGYIDELKLYDATLTKEQVLIDMNANSAINFGTGYREADALTDGAGNPPFAEYLYDSNTGSGTDAAVDTSGNDLHGVIDADGASESDWVPGKYGSAYRFYTGVDSETAITAADFESFFDPSEGTVSVWVKPTSTVYSGGTDYRILEVAVDSSNQLFIEAIGSSNIEFNYEANATEQLYQHATSTTEWTHLAMSWSSTDNEIVYYVNGRRVSSNSFPSGWTGSLADVTIGARVNADQWDGLIDQVRFYDYALSQSQVAYDFNRGEPVGWWRFDECSGTTAFDASVHGNNGTITPGSGTDPDNDATGTCGSGNGDEMWNDGTNGKFNSALGFDGSDDYVDMNDVDEVDFIDGQNFTITGWFYRDTFTTDDVIVAKKQNQALDAGFMAWIDDTNDDLRFVLADGDLTNYHTIDSTSSFTTTGWYHFAIVFDDSASNASEIYINGIDDNATNTTTGTFSSIGDLSNALDFRIGIDANGDDPFDGLLDDIRVYNYALSETQVRNVMNHGQAYFGD